MSEQSWQFGFEDLILRVKAALERGQAILFLGAGASMEGQGPSGRELTEKLLAQFPDVSTPNDEFLDVCQYIVDTPTHDVEQLRTNVRRIIEPIEVTQGHYRIARLPWAALFTTNYDDVIERAFIHRDCQRQCDPVYLEDQRLISATSARVPCFKLMGCIRRRAGEPGEMILTRAEYNNLSEARHRALAALYDRLKDGMLVFVGYSFTDRLAFDALDHLILKHGQDRIPWSYFIGPALPQDERTRYQLQK